jgi:hypothetical protein
MSDETKAIETIEAIAQDRYDWQQKYFALKAESEKLNAYVVLSIGELRTMIKRIEENNKTGFAILSTLNSFASSSGDALLAAPVGNRLVESSVNSVSPIDRLLLTTIDSKSKRKASYGLLTIPKIQIG